MKKYFIAFLILQSCLGAGDMFANREQIVGNYYLVESEGEQLISYKLGEDYIGRTPSNSRVLSYSIKDSFLVMKVQFYDSTINYYVLNMNKDSAFAELENVVIDTIIDKDYN